MHLPNAAHKDMGTAMKKHLLFVDDDASHRGLITLIFELAGYRVTTTDNGFGTLSQLLSDDYPSAVIIGDLSPAPETSLTLVNDVKVEFARLRLPVVMLSTQATPTDRTMGLAAGADRYMTKPFSTSTLLSTIEELLDEAA